MLKIGKHFFIIVSLLTIAIGLFAQQGSNPFELPGRVAPTKKPDSNNNDPKSSTTAENPFEINTDSTTEVPVEAANEATTEQYNPFEVNTPSTSSVSNSIPDLKTVSRNPFEIKKNTFTSSKKNTTKSKKKLAISDFEPLSGKFKLWMTILLVTILTVLANVYKSVLEKVYRSFLNDNFLKMVHRDYGTVTMIPYLILYSFSLILMGVFLFVLLNFYEISFFSVQIFNLLASIGVVFTIFMVKHLILQTIGSIFPISKEIEQYSFTIIIFGIIVGFFLFPIILLVSYAPPTLTISIIYGTFIFIGLVYLYRILRSLFIAIKYISLHKFHFFVYLCTIEIAPLLVLMKLATAT